jgi:DNA-binding PadR family transcriptional regulator
MRPLQNPVSRWERWLPAGESLKKRELAGKMPAPPGGFAGVLKYGFTAFFSLDIHIKSMYRVPMIRKELVAASAEPLILSLLAQGESYGYAIIQEVKARSDGKLQWTDGMLYPVLHRMEHRGLIKSRWGESETGRKRKYYSLKKDGKTAMAKHHEQWSLVHSVLAGLRKEQYV